MSCAGLAVGPFGNFYQNSLAFVRLVCDEPSAGLIFSIQLFQYSIIACAVEAIHINDFYMIISAISINSG